MFSRRRRSSVGVVGRSVHHKICCSAYRRGLGPHHNLTADAQRRIQTLTDRISARSVREEQSTSLMSTVRDWWSRRTVGRRAETHNDP
ncbi:hypothetical protein ROHU_006385 [Labeo rohita]|uniref:Uncharacterized protein n=1 Tax=Labeo rohita TaxID=84645 RepID=A0A498MV18_LABRO|nr:hypothetical protein ROHU_006385 [Labeo rohita]